MSRDPTEQARFRWGLPALALCFLVARPVTASGPAPHRQPARRPEAFTDGYQISRFLKIAAEVQALRPQDRAKRLRDLAGDPLRSSDVYPLCRMLFEVNDGGSFRRPLIGGAVFVGKTSYKDWPLEPIALSEGVPILVVRGFVLGGHPESAGSYLAYCLRSCRWRQQRYVPANGAQLKSIVDRFIAANPNVSADADWLRRQAD